VVLVLVRGLASGGTEEGASGISTLRTVIRGEISIMIGLRLSGVVGVPLDRLPWGLWSTYSKAIITAVYEALQFAHGKNIYHLDVSPGNIIFDVSAVQPRTMVSDCGCSVDGTNEPTLKNFHGCTPYAHDSLLANTKKSRSSSIRFRTLHHLHTHSTTSAPVN
jgi:serine/threonine protein kinase